jgi:hypothetical protein
VLRNIIFMRKVWGVSLFNPNEVLGIIFQGPVGEGDKGSILDLWGPDGYRVIAGKISEKVYAAVDEPC